MYSKPLHLYDMHIHSHFSGDSQACPFAVADAAIQKGLAGICFTDHMDMDYPKEPNIFYVDIPAYQKEIQKVKETYADSLYVGWGIELGLQPHIAAQNKQLTRENAFDFVIGSTHVVNHMDIYYPDFFEGRREDDCYRQYFEETLENVLSDTDFDVYGHLDYVIRYGKNKDTYYSYEKFADIIDEILRALLAKGKGIELNTAGLRYGLSHAHPTDAILRRYKELGGEILTLGSDGHSPEQIAWDFQKIPALLKSVGFDYFTIFEKRKPQFIKLP